MNSTTRQAAGRSRNSAHVRDLALTAVFAALLAILSWISITLPVSAVSFTLQTLGVFLCVGILGGKRGTLAVLVYILLGAVGLPVFAGFSGGLGALLGSSGGYIIGFLFSALAMWGLEKLWGSSTPALAAAMVIGLAVCYLFGTVWFMVVYTTSTGAVTLLTVLGWCVFPFLPFDLLKIALALALSVRLRPHVPR